MHLLTVFVLCLAVLVQASGLKLSARILGGEDADIRAFSYQVSLQQSGKHFCGGAIVTPTVVATAAHCTNRYPSNDLSVRAGTDTKESGGEVVSVSQTHPHPKFNAFNLDYDLSILQLANPLQLGEAIEIQPLGLEPDYGSLATATGWGALSEVEPDSSKLQKVQLSHFSRGVCSKVYGEITPRMICYWFPGRNSCQGDNGGPLVYRFKLVGIASWGYACSKISYPYVYIKVADADIHSHITQFL